jgi:hypothetical protein
VKRIGAVAIVPVVLALLFGCCGCRTVSSRPLRLPPNKCLPNDRSAGRPSQAPVARNLRLDSLCGLVRPEVEEPPVEVLNGGTVDHSNGHKSNGFTADACA